MNAKLIMASEDFNKCKAFHGHVCPGLSLGFRAAQAAMEHLKEQRSVDEEIVAVVENDACFVDAVQVLTGCTFGKGNFIFKDHGKMVLTVFSRNTGNGIRLAVRPDALKPGENQNNTEEALSPEERQTRLIHKILEKPATQLFNISKIHTSLPEKAQIHGSELCDICGESTMKTKLEIRDDTKVCKDCIENNRM